LRFSEEVSQEDIDEALNLMEECQSSLTDVKENEDDDIKKVRKDNVSKIYNIIKTVCGSKTDKSIAFSDLEKKVVDKGFSLSDLKKTLSKYQDIDVLMVSEDMSKVTLI